MSLPKRTLSRERTLAVLDPVLGWANIPGAKASTRIELPTLGLSHEWTWRTAPDGSRLTRQEGAAAGRDRVLVLGCSETFGVGLDDHQAYPWLLQERFPSLDVRNFGTPGYSCWQMLLLLQRLLAEEGTCAAVVLGFWWGLEMRNVPDWRHVFNLRRGKQPYVLSRRGKLRATRPTGWKYLPGSNKSPLVKTAEALLNRKLLFPALGQEDTMRTQQHVLLKLKKLCEERGIPLLVALVNDSSRYAPFLRARGFNWCLAYGPQRAGQLPFDPHMDAASHATAADLIAPALTRVLEGKAVTPTAEALHAAGYLADPGEELGDTFIYPLF